MSINFLAFGILSKLLMQSGKHDSLFVQLVTEQNIHIKLTLHT